MTAECRHLTEMLSQMVTRAECVLIHDRSLAPLLPRGEHQQRKPSFQLGTWKGHQRLPHMPRTCPAIARETLATRRAGAAGLNPLHASHKTSACGARGWLQ